MNWVKSLSLTVACCGLPGFLLADLVGLPGISDINVDYNLGTSEDSRTGDRQFTYDGTEHWSIEPGADNYFVGVYERPVNQGFGDNGGVWSTNSNYFENLDIVSGSLGYDSFYVYARIAMYGTAEIDQSGTAHEQGLKHFYRVRLGDLLLSSEDPAHKDSTPTEWGPLKNKIFQDTNGDVGTDGDGYDLQIVQDGYVSDGVFKDQHEKDTVLYSRISGDDENIVEFAFAYAHLGYTIDQLLAGGVVFEANKGTTDNQNYFWRFEYNGSEAGSPNPGGDSLSEFGTQGLGNIYELDTLLLGAPPPPVVVPEPSDMVYLMGPGLLFALIGRRYWIRRKKSKR